MIRFGNRIDAQLSIWSAISTHLGRNSSICNVSRAKETWGDPPLPRYSRSRSPLTWRLALFMDMRLLISEVSQGHLRSWALTSIEESVCPAMRCHYCTGHTVSSSISCANLDCGRSKLNVVTVSLLKSSLVRKLELLHTNFSAYFGDILKDFSFL